MGFGDLNTGKEYGDLDATKPKAGYVRSNVEYSLSHDGDLVSRGDLIEAGDIGYDRDRAEWDFVVITSTGFPRHRLGLFIIRLDDAGDLQVHLA